jgi:hypothetical protein
MQLVHCLGFVRRVAWMGVGVGALLMVGGVGVG